MIRYDDSELRHGLDEFDIKMQAALDIYTKTAAQRLQDEAVRNRPWTDRSNNARLSLKGTSEVDGNKARIVLSQGVDYGLWLELANEKKYAIVEPTIRLKGNTVVKGLEHFFKRLKS